MSKPFVVLVYGGRDYGDLASLRGNRADPRWPRREREYQHIQHELTRLSLGWPSTEPDRYGNSLPRVTMRTGGASGVDSVAIDWAVVNLCECEEILANWNDLTQPGARIRTRRDGSKYDASAGPRRNQRMIDMDPRISAAVEFPGGDGTADMRCRLIAAGITPTIIPRLPEESRA